MVTKFIEAIIVGTVIFAVIVGWRLRAKMTAAELRKEKDDFDDAW